MSSRSFDSRGAVLLERRASGQPPSRDGSAPLLWKLWRETHYENFPVASLLLPRGCGSIFIPCMPIAAGQTTWATKQAIALFRYAA